MKKLLLLVLFCATTSSFAASVVRYTVSGIPMGGMQDPVYYLDETHVRQPVSPGVYYLYDASKDKLTLVNSGNQSIYPVSRHYMRDLSKMIDAQKRKIHKLLQSDTRLSPELKTRLRSSLRSLESAKNSAKSLGGESPSVNLEGPEGKEVYAGIECSHYAFSLSRQGGKGCFAASGQSGLSRKSLVAFTAFQRFLSQMVGQPNLLGAKPDSLAIWLETTKPVHGRIELKSIVSREFDADFFTVPAGYQTMDLKAGMPLGH